MASQHSHSRQRCDPGAATEAEQHRLGLVVLRVAEEHKRRLPGRAEPLGDRVEGREPGGAGSRLWAACRPRLHDSHLDGLEAKVVTELGNAPGLLFGASLQAVIDSHERGGVSGPRRLEGDRRSQRERIGTSRTCHHQRPSGPRVASQGRPDCEPDGSDGRGRSHGVILADPTTARPAALPCPATVRAMHPADLPHITATEAAAQVRQGAYLLDVREQHEWIAGHAPEAVHIPMSELNERAAEIPPDSTVICVCHAGGRSARVTEALNHAGWTAVNLAGGMEAWQAGGHPVVDGEGKPGTVV